MNEQLYEMMDVMQRTLLCLARKEKIPEKNILELEKLGKLLKQVSEEYNETMELEQTVTDYLKKLAVPVNLKGFNYLRYGILLNIQKPKAFKSFTGDLYPEIAKKFDSTPTRVERAIRHAIEISFTRGNHEYQKLLFGQSIDSIKKHPTNRQFVLTVVDEIRLFN